MKFGKLLPLLLCIVLCTALLPACGEQAGVEPTGTVPTTEATQPIQTEGGLEEGELPAVTLPQETEPVTEPTEATQPVENTEPATEPTEATRPQQPTEQETQPPEISQPSQPTQPTETEPSQQPTEPVETTPPVTTEPVETTPPVTTEPTEPPRLDEDELPPIPVF